MSYSVTVTQTFTINAGIDLGTEEDDMKGSASIGASYSWAIATAQSNTQTFPMNPGEEGHIVFWPLYHQSCGEQIYVGADCGYGPCTYDGLIGDDPNACGNTPLLTGTGQADGVLTLCLTGGPHTGEGCSPPPVPSVY